MEGKAATPHQGSKLATKESNANEHPSTVQQQKRESPSKSNANVKLSTSSKATANTSVDASGSTLAPNAPATPSKTSEKSAIDEQLRIAMETEELKEKSKKLEMQLRKELSESSKRLQQESMKLRIVEQELLKLSESHRKDVDILRSKIEEVGRTLAYATKDYEVKKEEFLTAENLVKKLQSEKAILTTHLQTIIFENETRKSEKLSSLMAELNIKSTSSEGNTKSSEGASKQTQMGFSGF